MRHASSALATLALLAASAAARPDGVGGHHHAHHAEHGATAPAAAEPLSGHATPDAGYAAPDAGYASPDVSSGYGAPESGYGEPSYGYTATGTGGGYVAETAGADGMSMIIIPLLIAAALFLLFPSVVNVDVNATQAGRKKRAVTGELHKQHRNIFHKHKNIFHQYLHNIIITKQTLIDSKHSDTSHPTEILSPTPTYIK